MAFHAQLAEVARCLARMVSGAEPSKSGAEAAGQSYADHKWDTLCQMLIEVPTSTSLAPLYIGRAPELAGSGYSTDDQNALLERKVGMLVCLLEEEECIRYGGSIDSRIKATLESRRLSTWDFIGSGFR